VNDAFGVEISKVGLQPIRMGSPVKAVKAAVTGVKRGMSAGGGGASAVPSAIKRGATGAFKSSPGTVLAAGGGAAGVAGGYGISQMRKSATDAFGVNREDISKGAMARFAMANPEKAAKIISAGKESGAFRSGKPVADRMAAAVAGRKYGSLANSQKAGNILEQAGRNDKFGISSMVGGKGALGREFRAGSAEKFAPAAPAKADRFRPSQRAQQGVTSSERGQLATMRANRSARGGYNRPQTGPKYVTNGKGVPRAFRKIKARVTNAPKTARSV